MKNPVTSLRLFFVLLYFSLPSIIWAQPSNDECTTAIRLTITTDCEPQIFSNLNATQSGIGEIPECFNGGAIDRDVWFTFSVPTDGSIENLKITVARVIENSIDLPQVALYRGTCEIGELSDVGLCASAELLDNEIVVRALGLTPNIQYFLRVNDYSETATPNWGNFSICIEELPPVFNMGDIDRTNLCAGTLYDSGGPDGDYESLEEETFTICPTDFHDCIEINLETYNTEEDFDELFLYKGDLNDLELIRTVSGEGFQTIANAGSGCVTIGFISDFLIQGEGFKLTWECTPSICPPQEERSCSDPHTITTLPYEANNLSTCLSGNNIEDGPCSNDLFLAGDDYVFAYTSTGDECISIAISGVIEGTGVSVFRGCPNSNISESLCLAQDNSTEEGVLRIQNVSFREADTYYIVIAQGSNCTPFNITITPSADCPMVFPSAAQCANALLLNGCDTDLPAALTVEPGQGEIDFFQLDVNNGCWEGVLETNYTWFTFEAQADGEFAFLLSNNIQDEALDIDFNIWGPFENVSEACAASYDSQPLRSSWADDLLSTTTGLTNINPVLGTPVTSLCQGALSDGFVKPIEVKKGEVYVVLVNDFDGVIFNGAVAIDFGESTNGILGANENDITISPDTSICIGTNTQLLATGGSLYEWSPKEGLSCTTCPNPIATPSKTTTYTVQASSVCKTVTKSMTIEVYNLEAGIANEVCLGEVIPLNVSENTNNVQFEWIAANEGNLLSCTDCPNPTLTALSTGTFQYEVILTTPVCELRDTYHLSVLEGMAFDFVVPEDQSICIGTSVSLGGVAVAGNRYAWTSSEGQLLSTESELTVNPDTTTTYIFEVKNENCSAPAVNTITVEVSDVPIITLISDTTICQGTAVRLGNFLEQDGVSYEWSSSDNSFSSSVATPTVVAEATTTYQLKATSGGCSNEMSVSVEVIPINIEFQQNEDTLELCLGDVLSLNPTVTPNGMLPTIMDQLGSLDTAINVIDITVSSNGLYIASISNEGCFSADTLVVQVDSLPTNMRIMPFDTTVCEGTELILQSPLYDPIFFPNIQHLWMPDAGFETPDSLYNLVMTASDSVILMRINTNGACVDTSLSPIQVNPIEEIPITPVDPLICVGNSLTLQAAIPEGTEELMWMPEGATSCVSCPNPTVSPTMPTTYTLSGMLNGCPISGSQTVEVIDVGMITIFLDGPIDNFFQGDTLMVRLLAEEELTSIEWFQDEENLPEYSDATTLTYTPLANENLNGISRMITISARYTTIAGCEGIAVLSVDLVILPPIQRLPNAFTPDGDGTNDFFNLITVQGRRASVLSFKIYDRWGRQVYDNDAPSLGWNGSYKGERQNPDVYVYVIEYQVGDRIETRSGDVTLIR